MFNKLILFYNKHYVNKSQLNSYYERIIFLFKIYTYIYINKFKKLAYEFYISTVSNFFYNQKLKLIDLENYYTKKFFKFEVKTSNEYEIIKQNRSLTYAEVINLLYRRQKTKYYAPFLSFWPLFLTCSIALFLIFVAIFLHSSSLYNYLNGLTLISIFAVILSISFWFSIFFIEKKKGNHVVEIRRNIELGFYLFLFTEAICFLALFWVFLHSFLAASLHIGIYNPGEGIANLYINEFFKINKNWNIYLFNHVGTPAYYRTSSFYTVMDRELYENTKSIKIHINFYDRGQLIDPYKLPLLNTFILLTSAACLNVSHISIRTSKFLKSFLWLFITIILGLFFVFVQYKEYKECSFQYNDGIYAACFFSLTGLHGLHVMIGISALVICCINLLFQNYSPNFHQSYMYSIFYWHFVDVIWIFVYFIIYLWPASYFFVDEIYTNYKKFFTINFSKNFLFKVLNYNQYVLFIHNNKIFYFNFCDSFNVNCINKDISFNFIWDNHSINNYFSQKWSFIKSIALNNRNIAFSSETNLDWIINKVKLKFNDKTILSPVLSIVKLVKYSDINGFYYPKNNISGFYELKQPIFLFSTADVFNYVNLFYELENLFNSGWQNHNIHSESKFVTFYYENYLLKCHDLNHYRNSFYYGWNVFEEYFSNDLIKYKDMINYNAIKKDPDTMCFILTEMHNDLMYCVENAYLKDLQYKYKKFFIYLFLSKLNLQYLKDYWCFFFFPYVLTRDASIRHNI